MSLFRRNLIGNANSGESWSFIATFRVSGRDYLFSYKPNDYDSSNQPDYVETMIGLYLLVTWDKTYYPDNLFSLKIIDNRNGNVVYEEKSQNTITLNIGMYATTEKGSATEEYKRMIETAKNKCSSLYLLDKMPTSANPYYFDVYINGKNPFMLHTKDVTQSSPKSGGNTYHTLKQVYSIQKNDNATVGSGMIINQ